MQIHNRTEDSRLSAYMVILVVALLSAVNFSPVLGKAKEQKKSPTLVLESANSNENTYNNGEFVSILRGNVNFSYDDISIRSDEATWWRNQGIVSFRNNVQVTRGSSKLSCDRMHFTKANNLLTASGRFKFIDTVEQAQLLGKEAEYHLDSRYFQLKGNPKMIRYDTATAETLTITGLQMSYIDTLKKAIVTDSVRITKGKLFSKCKYAHYFTDINSAQLRVAPSVTYEMHRVSGDSIDLQFGKESLKSAVIMGNAHGAYVDTGGASADTAFTNVWGDSLYMSVSDSGNLDSLWVYRKAVSKHYVSSTPELVNEASGKVMLMSFGVDGKANNVKIWGNARSTYFIEEKDSKGTNQASGDSITVAFKRGKASILTLAGSARGIFFPRDL